MRHVLCIAPQESQAEALSAALASVPEVLVVGICDPAQAAQLARVVGADLLVASHDVALPDTGLPVFTAPEDADPAEALQAYLEAHAKPAPESPPATPRLPFAPVTRQVRLGFYGVRGGVGVTTAAVTAAKLLAAQGQRVALYDAAQRGDPYLLLGLTPSAQPASAEGITVYPALPTADAEAAAASIIDGGRERRLFPARWLALEHPLAEAEIAKLLGLA